MPVEGVLLILGLFSVVQPALLQKLTNTSQTCSSIKPRFLSASIHFAVEIMALLDYSHR